MYNVYVRWVRDGSWALVFVCVLGGFPMSVCAVLSTMRTRQILFLSCTPWPLTLVENFDKKSSTWGSWPHVEHRRPGGRRWGSGGSWAACWASWSWDVLHHSLPQNLHDPPLTYQRTARHPETISNTGCPRVSTANDDTAPSQGFTTLLRHHVPQPSSAVMWKQCRGYLQRTGATLSMAQTETVSGGSYLQSTLWRMINLLLNMQTDHLAITGKSTPLKNTALENARFPPRAIHWYWIIHHFKVPTYLHAHETVYRINPYHNIPQQSHECMFYTNTQTCTNTWHCVS